MSDWKPMGRVPPQIALTGVPVMVWCRRRPWTDRPHCGPGFWQNGTWQIATNVDGDLRFEMVEAEFWRELPTFNEAPEENVT